MTIGSLFFIGALSSVRIIVGFTYMLELIGAPYRTMYGTLWGINENLVYLWATLYFWKVGKNVFPLLALGYGINIVAVVGVYFLPESPVYLIKKGNLEEARKSLEFIARVNGKDF